MGQEKAVWDLVGDEWGLIDDAKEVEQAVWRVKCVHTKFTVFVVKIPVAIAKNSKISKT